MCCLAVVGKKIVRNWLKLTFNEFSFQRYNYGFSFLSWHCLPLILSKAELEWKYFFFIINRKSIFGNLLDSPSFLEFTLLVVSHTDALSVINSLQKEKKKEKEVFFSLRANYDFLKSMKLYLIFCFSCDC